MLRSKNYNYFSQSVTSLLKKTEGKPIHLYWKDYCGYWLGCNVRQEELIKQCNDGLVKEQSLIQHHVTELVGDCDALIEATQNDAVILTTASMKMFIEHGFRRECLSIKAPLWNQNNQVIGVGGISFYFDEINLHEITTLINDLEIIHPFANQATDLYCHHALPELTVREKECARYLVKGMTAKEIGRVLKISYRTVECHIENIKAKFGCSRQAQLVSMIMDSKTAC